MSSGSAPVDLPALERQLQDISADLLLSGASVLVRSPEIGEWTMTYGHRAVDGVDPIQRDDHFRIGSITKTWTATVILELVDEGELALSDPVSKYRPDVPGGDSITIEQMLGMRSGLFSYTGDLGINQIQDADHDHIFTADELLSAAYAHGPNFAPGTRYQYSNTNTVLLGLIAEQLTGLSGPELYKQRLFDKAGMSSSSFPDTSDDQIPEPFIRGYTWGTNVGTMDTNELPPEIQAQARDGSLQTRDATNDNPSWTSFAGQGISTLPDLARYVKMLVGGGLLSPQLQQQRLDSVEPIDPGNPASAGYGLGLAQFGPLYGHTGELPGYNTFMGHDPARDLTIVVTATPAPAVDGRAPATTLAMAIISEFSGH